MKIESKQNLLMIGDSITEAADGYVHFVDLLLAASYPERSIRVFNKGVSGNTVRDLMKRWDTDVLEYTNSSYEGLRIHWVSIMIGVNDVWRQFDTPHNRAIHVYAEEFEKTLDELVAQTQPLLSGLVLMTPFLVETKREDPMRAMVERYASIVRQISQKRHTLLVDTQAAFDQAMAYHSPNRLSPDRVHPSPLGHMVLAKAFLQALDFAW